MIDLIGPLEKLRHQIDQNETIEESDFEAYKVDGRDGLINRVGFLDMGLSGVDYFYPHEKYYYLIEMTDLKQRIKNYTRKNNGGNADFGQMDAVCRMELEDCKKKWMGSIATIERYHRKICTEENKTTDPVYRFCLVLKNDTDTKIKDALQSRLSGSFKGIKITTTNDFTSVINTSKKS